MKDTEADGYLLLTKHSKPYSSSLNEIASGSQYGTSGTSDSLSVVENVLAGTMGTVTFTTKALVSLNANTFNPVLDALILPELKTLP